MSDLAVRVSRLSKHYRIGLRPKYDTLREALVRGASAPVRRVSPRAAEDANGFHAASVWALRDVDLDVEEGTVLGIIGRNGAGKSTLLKILAGITEPTSGFADLYGRVGSLLEVGTGFHMELTGRENIFMNGAMLGMSRSEIRRKFDDIVAFSEVEKFLDTPVKRYSSGMYMRLAFAVAAHLEPEILVVDEVLAVGDAAFQKKCLGKMSEVARGGRTVLFVSHNMSTIQALCEKAVWLDEGSVRGIGSAPEVVAGYLESVTTNEPVSVAERVDRDGDGTVRIRSLQIEDADEAGVIRSGSRLKVTIGYESQNPVRRLQAYVSVYDLSHTGIFALDSDASGGLPDELPRYGTLTCVTEPINLTAGRCYVNAGLVKGGAIADRIEGAAYFDVEPQVTYGSGKAPGRDWVLCLLDHSWSAGEGER